MANKKLRGLGLGRGRKNVHIVYRISELFLSNEEKDLDQIIEDVSDEHGGTPSPYTIKNSHCLRSLHLYHLDELPELIRNGKVVDRLKNKHPKLVDEVDKLFNNLYPP